MIDRTLELKRRLVAMRIYACDTCDFWRPCKDNLVSMWKCENCAYGVFEKSDGELCRTGFCKLNESPDEKATRELAETKRMLEALVENAKGGIITCVFNSSTQCWKTIYINPGWTDITGYTLEDLNVERAGNPQDLVFQEDKEAVDTAYMEQTAKGNEYELMYRVYRRDGAIIWVMDRGIVSELENGDLQNQSIVTEVTAIKEQEENLRKLAQTDQLTNLYNKGTATMLAQKVLDSMPQKHHAVFTLDIDGFKRINDSMGHTFGDIVLRQVADRLRNLFCSDDILVRLGGDEFGMFMIDVSYELVKKKAEMICADMRKIKINNGIHPPITVSLGVAISEGKISWEGLYEQADIALYMAKRNGKNQYYINAEKRVSL